MSRAGWLRRKGETSHIYREETYLKFYLDQFFMLITILKPEMRNNILPGWGGMKHACCSLF